MNPFDQPVTLRKGTTIGIATTAELQEVSNQNIDTCRATTHRENAISSNSEEKYQEASPTSQTEAVLPEHLEKLFADSSKNLNDTEKGKLQALLIEFADIFSKHENDLGLTHLIEHTIDVDGAKPIKFAPRKVPLAYAGEDRKALEQMLEKGCIRPSTSPWGAPITFARKKDGSVRCCLDTRALNQVTVKDAYPLPRTEDCINAVAGAKFFSTMDITSAYNQIPIKEEDIPKTAFTTKYGLYEHVTMPFGLCNAPATFQRLMEIVLSKLQWQTCLIYLDDVICFSSTFDQHIERLRGIWQCIRLANLKLKPKKCHLIQTEVKFLGFILSSEGVLPDPDNVARLQEWSTPTCVKHVRAFLGLGNFYRRFIKNYSKLVKPLTDLTKKGTTFQWTDTCQNAFTTLKTALLGPEIMAYPTDDGEYQLACDACDVSIGAVLSQVQQGRERVIAYGSRKLNKAEQNYCVTDKECLAVKHFCEYYRQYLLGRKFKVVSDHQALKWLFSMKEPKSRIARWIEALSPFNFTLEYKPGRLHTNADAMSRCPNPKSCMCDEDAELKCGPCSKCTRRADLMCGQLPGKKSAETPEAITEQPKPERVGRCSTRLWALPYSADELRKKQLDDPDIGPVLHWVEAGERPTSEEVQATSAATRHYWLHWNSLQIKNRQLYRVITTKDGTDTQSQFILPRSLRDEILKQGHQALLGGHLGQKKTRGKIKRSFYWFGIREDVNSWVLKCDECAASTKPSKAPRGPMANMTVGSIMDRLSTDVVGPFPRTSRGNEYILVVTCHFSKWVEIFAIPDQSAATTARVILNEVIARYGSPYSILSDRGRNYESGIYRELCRLLEIRKVRTTTANPQGNGQTERFNRTLLKMIRAYIHDDEDTWDLNLGCLAGAYRATPHESTGLTPKLIMLGREVRLPVEVMLGSGDNADAELASYGHHISKIRDCMQKAHDVTRTHLGASARRQKQCYDAKMCFYKFKVGDLVWYATNRSQLHQAPKLRKPFEDG